MSDSAVAHLAEPLRGLADYFEGEAQRLRAAADLLDPPINNVAFEVDVQVTKLPPKKAAAKKRPAAKKRAARPKGELATAIQNILNNAPTVTMPVSMIRTLLERRGIKPQGTNLAQTLSRLTQSEDIRRVSPGIYQSSKK